MWREGKDSHNWMWMTYLGSGLFVVSTDSWAVDIQCQLECVRVY